MTNSVSEICWTFNKNFDINVSDYTIVLVREGLENSAVNTTNKPATKRPRTHVEINEFRRNAFVEGAIRSLAEFGVAGTTVSTICKAAGSSRGLLGHYFASKDEVMVAALQHLFGGISRSVQESTAQNGGTAIDRLQAIPAALFAPSVFTELNRTAFLALWHETRFNEKVRKANRELYRGYIKRMESMFAAAAEELALDIDTRRSALGLVGLTDGLWLGMSIHDDVLTRQQVIDMCHDYISRELRLG